MEDGVGCGEGGAMGRAGLHAEGEGYGRGVVGTVDGWKSWEMVVVSAMVEWGAGGCGGGAGIDPGNPCGPVDVCEEFGFEPLGEGRKEDGVQICLVVKAIGEQNVVLCIFLLSQKTYITP